MRAQMQKKREKSKRKLKIKKKQKEGRRTAQQMLGKRATKK